MGSYKNIGLSHEKGLIDTPPFFYQHSLLYWAVNVVTGGKLHVSMCYAKWTWTSLQDLFYPIF